MGIATQTATEASAVAAVAIAVGFAFSGAWGPAIIATLLGVILFAVYEYLGYEGIQLSEEQIEQIVEESNSQLEEVIDRQSNN